MSKIDAVIFGVKVGILFFDAILGFICIMGNKTIIGMLYFLLGIWMVFEIIPQKNRRE